MTNKERLNGKSPFDAVAWNQRSEAIKKRESKNK
jgi:hypothetical protein